MLALAKNYHVLGLHDECRGLPVESEQALVASFNFGFGEPTGLLIRDRNTVQSVVTSTSWNEVM